MLVIGVPLIVAVVLIFQLTKIARRSLRRGGLTESTSSEISDEF